MISTPLDPRRHAYREDLAAEALRGRVTAPRYVAGEVRQVVHASTPVRARPDARESWTTEALFGESVRVFDERDGWCWGQLEADGYVGYVRSIALTGQVRTPTHRVRTLGTFLYPAADIKAAPWLPVSMNALLSVVDTVPGFARLADGSFVPMRHIVELGRPAPDFVTIAEQFLGTPYLWGGRSRLGVDCSGLVQVAAQAAGLACPRDSDMQLAEFGAEIPVPAQLDTLARGDLVFWPGHVGIMTDSFLLLHANAHHMSVVIEPLLGAAERIARAGSQLAAIKRLAQYRAHVRPSKQDA